jgi:hypothetical protein
MSIGRLRAGVAMVTVASAMVVGARPNAQPVEPPPRPSLNLYGISGLIDMPSAEAQPDGQMSATYAIMGETTRRNFTFQILPRISGTLRYSTIDNWGNSEDPSYDLFDRSFDVQFQLMNENRDGWRPSLALGLRDFLGTGVYSSEYVVLSKTVFEYFTLTGGVGWGRLAGVNTAESPFCAVSDSFCERDTDFGRGGDLETDTYFRGEDVGFFGGVEWRATEKFRLKAEISSDAYSREQRGPEADFERNSPVNLGVEYSPVGGVTLGGYYMYGSTFGLNLVVSGNPKNPPVPQDLGPGPLPVIERPEGGNRSTAWVDNPAARERLTDAIAEALSPEGVTLEATRYQPHVVDIQVVNRQINQPPKAIGRTARVLANVMPYSVDTFRITVVERGVPATTVTIDRAEYEAQVDRPGAGVASWRTTEFSGAVPVLSGEVWRRDVYPFYDWALVPVPSIQVFGGVDGFRPQLSAELRASAQITPRFSFSGRIRQPILGEFSDPGPSEGDRALPPVRRESARYYSGWNPKLMRLTGDYLFKINPDTYGRASAGYLERQFAGVSGEVLWKPVEQTWGLGLELNYVAQREPESFSGFTGYEVATGHATVYWNTGWYGIETSLSAGRYLAGDWGGTFAVERRFRNGWAAGAYVTRTDVSADDFGEGSFDKGITLSIPLRWTTPFETQQTISGDLRSLSSDGGAQLDIANRLYPIVRDLDRAHLEQNWGAFWQ